MTENITGLDTDTVNAVKVSEVVRERLRNKGVRFFANDNISEHISEFELQEIQNELAYKFQDVLETLIIDTDNDPNSEGTAKRLAKMYINELMQGRYFKAPAATAFPNTAEDKYEGMLVVTGVAYIGIIAADKLIGLSKYTRIAQWCARRGTLQEELCNDIAKEIMDATNAKDVGVYIQATHGCCENRGIMAHSSLTQTSVLKGAFKTDPSTKKEFFDNIKLQQEFAPR